MPRTLMVASHMKDFTPDSISTASGRLRFGTWLRRVGLLLLFASFLLILSAGCDDGQVPADDSSELAAFPPA